MKIKEIEKTKNNKAKNSEIVFQDVLSHNYRALKYGQLGKLTQEQANIALKYFNNRCAYSGEDFVKSQQNNKIITNLNLEHIIPLVMGGNSMAYNCVPSVMHYNLRKSAHHPLDWWQEQEDVDGNKIFNPIRLLKLVNYMLKCLKYMEEKDINKYKKRILSPNEIDKYINKNKEQLISNTKVRYKIEKEKIKLQEIPNCIHIRKLKSKRFEYRKIKTDLFILDCIGLLEQYHIPDRIIQNLKQTFTELKELEKVFEKIPKEEKIQENLINYLKKVNIEKIYTVALAVNIKEIEKNNCNISTYINKKLEPIYRELKIHNIEKSNINIIIDSEPRVIENREEQEIAIQMIKNFQSNKNERFKEYYTKLENKVKVKDEMFIKELLKSVENDIKYLSKEEIIKLEEKLKYNPLSNRREGRKLKTAYDSLYKSLEKQGLEEPELSKETSKAFIYAKIGPEGFTAIIDKSKFSKAITQNVLKNYKEGIKELDFYLLENKKDKPVKEADKELTKEVLERTRNIFEELTKEEMKILKRRLEFNSKTCQEHGTRLMNTYNRIFYALKKQGIKEPDLSLEASKAYIYCKICKIGFYSIQCNEKKYKDIGMKKVLENYEKSIKNICYYLLDDKSNIPKKEADKETTKLVLNFAKEITEELDKKEKEMLKKQLLQNSRGFDNKMGRLIIAYNQIYYQLKKRKMEEPELSIETSKAYIYAKIAQAGFFSLFHSDPNLSEKTVLKILSEYKEGIKQLHFYILSNASNENVKKSNKDLTKKVLENAKDIIQNLNEQEKEKLEKILLTNERNKEYTKKKLINAYSRIYCEMKIKGLKEPELSKEASKAYIYAKISDFGFGFLLVNKVGYTKKNLNRLLKEYKEGIKDLEFYLLDNKKDINIIQADNELTEMVLKNIEEITEKLDLYEKKTLEERLVSNSKGTKLINVYNKIYYALKKQGMIEPELSKEASKAYTYAKIFDVGLGKISSEKEKMIKKIIKNYPEELKDIHYQLLRNTQDRVEIDDKNLTNFVIENTKDVLKKLSMKEQDQVREKLLYNQKSNIQDGIRQRNAYNRIYCEMKKQGIEDSKLEKETCKAYLYAKISKIGFFNIVRFNKKTTEKTLKKLVNEYEEGLKKLDYYLMCEKTIRIVENSDVKLAEYIIEKANSILKELSEEKIENLKEILSYNSKSCLEHGTRLINAYNKICYELKKKELKEPELSIEASKIYIYTKVFSKSFSDILQCNNIEKTIQPIIEKYNKELKDLDIQLIFKGKNNKERTKNMIDKILENINDILCKMSKEEQEKIKQRLLEDAKNNNNNCIYAFNGIYKEIRKNEKEEKEIMKKTCLVYLYGTIGPIGFGSIIKDDKYYSINIKKIIELYKLDIDLLDYYLLYPKCKSIEKENIELSEKVYDEIVKKLPNLTEQQKENLHKKLLHNSEKQIRFLVAYNKIYYTLKKEKIIEPELNSKAKIIYAYIKIAQKAFDSYIRNKRYIEKEYKSKNLKQYLKKIDELEYYTLDFYDDLDTKKANKLLTEKVIKKSGIKKILPQETIEEVKLILQKELYGEVKLVVAYNRIYIELYKRGMKEPELTKETSKAYIYSKIAKCGFSDILDNTKMIKQKLDILLERYAMSTKEIRFKLLQNKPSNEKKDKIFTDKILENAKEILKELNNEEIEILKEKLTINSHKGSHLINVYNRIYNELIEKGLEEPNLTKEATKAYIYSKIGFDGFTEIRDNRKSSTKILKKVLEKYNKEIKRIKYYLLYFYEDKNVEEADKDLVNQILETTKGQLGKLYNSKEFRKYVNYNSQNKSKMVNVYNKIYFEISKLEKNKNKMKLEASKAFIYAKIGPEGFKQIQNNNQCSDECVENVIKYYKKGFEIIKQDFLDGKLDFSKRVLYTRRGVRKRIF